MLDEVAFFGELPYQSGVSVQRDASSAVDNDSSDGAPRWCSSTLVGPGGIFGSPGAANEECEAPTPP